MSLVKKYFPCPGNNSTVEILPRIGQFYSITCVRLLIKLLCIVIFKPTYRIRITPSRMYFSDLETTVSP